MDKLSALLIEAEQAIETAVSVDGLEALRVIYLGKKGHFTLMLKALGSIAVQDRAQHGQRINQAKQKFVEVLQQKKTTLDHEALLHQLKTTAIDVTRPGRRPTLGTQHPLTHVRLRVLKFFNRYGFQVVSGPEIEDEYHNFSALNMAKNHPARAMHDTFYFGDGRLLRTHTSPVQIRALQTQAPPCRLLAPGRVYRCDSDLTHTPMFHQLEALVIEPGATMANLYGLLQQFFNDFFALPTQLRFRPSYFPFTEPSAEVDLKCMACQGSGCRICQFSGWLEVMGCGMVHPKVLQAAGLSPDTHQGWAFGMGIDRLTMLYYNIADLRLLFEHDLAFLQQF